MAIFYAFKEFGYLFWGTPKPINILTDNKSVTRFFQTTIIPQPLWNAFYYMIQFSYTIAHISGKNNTAADYLSRVELDPNKKLILKIREDVETRSIEVNVQSANVSEEAQVFFTEEEDETEKQTWDTKKCPKRDIKSMKPTYKLMQYLKTTWMKSLIQPRNCDELIRYCWSKPDIQFCSNLKQKSRKKSIPRKFSNRTFGANTI